jgi:hypothetical protein
MLPLPFLKSVTVLQCDVRSRQNLTSVSQLAKKNTIECCSSAIYNTQSKTKTVKPRQLIFAGAFYNTRLLSTPKTYKKKDEIEQRSPTIVKN